VQGFAAVSASAAIGSADGLDILQWLSLSGQSCSQGKTKVAAACDNMYSLLAALGRSTGVFLMSLQKMILRAAAGAALGLGIASAASAATVVHVNSGSITGAYFYITSGTPTSPSITAEFGDTIHGSSKPFDDDFQFTIDQNGVGSGSLSTSFSSKLNQLDITKVIINGTTYTPVSSAGGQTLAVNGIPILDGVLNHIEVEGSTVAGASAASFTGTATFAASATPEPATWALMIAGIGGAGLVLRRAKKTMGFGAVAA
ncbi:MAG: PEP-CTERM sorting domain-containing protein, partial [Caulobacteraceae bacterium]|nr:PEP-CTERM sorting domain-containing protein [Caulobacteraceae bacterium]